MTELPKVRERSSAEVDLESKLRAALDAAQAFYEKRLQDTPKALDYLKRRGISEAFLKEAGEVFGQHEQLLEASDMMGKTANRWREFTYLGARNCKNRSKPEEDYGKLADMLHEIAGMEEAVYKKLDKIKL